MTDKTSDTSHVNPADNGSSGFVPVDPFEIVVFGGTGDLARRKLIPSLYHRFVDGQFNNASKIIHSCKPNTLYTQTF